MSNVISPSFRNELVEGNHKVIYESETKGIFVAYFKEEEIAIAEIRALISAKLFSVLTFCGVKNHFLCSNGIVEHKIIALDMLPFKLVVYSVVNHELSKKIFLKPGLKLDKYLVEIYLKNSESPILLSKEHLVSLGSLPEHMIDYMIEHARRVMDIIISFFYALDLTVFSLSLSFGKRYKNDGKEFDLLLSDEMSLKNINLFLDQNASYSLNETYLKIARQLNF